MSEDKAPDEISSFICEGLKDIAENNLVDADRAFDELEGRYLNADSDK